MATLYGPSTPPPANDPYKQPFGEAAQSVEDQRRRSNEAMAMAGTAGRQAVTDAQARIAQQRQMTVDRAIQESQKRGAPQEAQDVVRGRIEAPYNERSLSLDQGQANRAQDIGYRTAGTEQYFSQVAPAVQAGHDRALSAYERERARQDAEKALQRQQLEQQIAMQQYQAEQDALDRQWQQDQANREFEYEMAMDKQKFDEDVRRYGIEQAMDIEKMRLSEASRGRSGGGGGGGSSGYYDTGFTKTELKDQFPGLVSQVRGTVDRGNLMGSKLGKLVGLDKTLQSGVAGSIARGIGMPGSVGNSLLGKYSSGLKNTGLGRFDAQGNEQQGDVPKEQIYTDAVDWLQRQYDSGRDPFEIAREIRGKPYGMDSATNRAIQDVLGDGY